MSVGSVTITETRKEVLDFTQPYYFTPAQMATTEGTGIETFEDFSGQDGLRRLRARRTSTGWRARSR